MSLPVNSRDILDSLDIPRENYELNKKSDGTIVLNWLADPASKPTDQEIIDRGNSPEFAVWYAEHGGDPDLTRRRIAKELIDKVDAQEQALRAVVLAVNARTNQIANRLNQVLDAIDSSNNHGQLLTNIGAIADLPTIPKTELRTTIFSYVTSGESDGPIQD